MTISRPATRKRGLRLVSVLLFALPWIVLPKAAHAYLDPGTGSILLQVLIGGVAGLGVIVKLYWHRLRGLLGLREKDAPKERPPAVK